MKQEIAITGGTGFIGSSLSKHLLKRFKVKLVDVKPPMEGSSNLAEFERCDIRDYKETANALKTADLVIHTAIVQIPLINENKSLGYEVNVTGTQNVLKAVEANSGTKGMILSGTWHTIGERDLHGIVDEEFGFRPDKVEERARLYALSKMAQESMTRLYDEMSTKIYGILRMGTVLGDAMPRETAANLFIEKGLKGEPITPYKHSMYRPMLYVDIRDICKAYEIFASKILNDEFVKSNNSLSHIVNVYNNQPMTILELANSVRQSIIEKTGSRLTPTLQVVDKGLPLMFNEDDKNRIEVRIEKAKALLGMDNLISTRDSLRDIINQRLVLEHNSGENT